MASENIIMAMVQRAAVTRHVRVKLCCIAFLNDNDLHLLKQDVHEKIRQLAAAAGNRVKQEGLENDLLDRIRQHDYFAPIRDDLDQLLDPSTFVGRASQQVDEFLRDEVEPVLAGYREKGQLGIAAHFAL